MSDGGAGGSNRYCSACGSPLTPGASFCPNCGTAVASSTTSSQPPWDRRSYRDWRRQQRQNYYSEKYEKREKQEKHEKGSGEPGNMIGPLVGALILIWLGVTFYLQDAGLLPASNWWAYFIAGIGVIVIIQGIARYIEYRGPYLGSVIGGGVLFIIGLSFIGGFASYFWPLILIIIGIAVLASAFVARGRRPTPPANPPTSS